MNENSCVGCKFLYLQDTGYSNYTVLDTDVNCAIGRNVHLPAEMPYDWQEDPDNWPATQDSRCERYVLGNQVHLDVEGEVSAKDCTDDPEVIDAIDGSPEQHRDSHG